MLTPSNTTLSLENGTLAEVPANLKKGNPSFHLIMAAPESSTEFCKTILSAMLLNYPPPTIVNWGKSFEDDGGNDVGKLKGVYEYLKDTKKVKEDDLVLVVDAYDVWFQLPSDVVIKQYQAALRESNRRLLERYGWDDSETAAKRPKPKYTQSVIWGATKIPTCPVAYRERDLCLSVPEPSLPPDLYGELTDQDERGILNRPWYLDAASVIGPAKDVRDIFRAAIQKSRKTRELYPTAQLLLSEVFGEQEYARSSTPQPASWRSWLSWGKTTGAEVPTPAQRLNLTLDDRHRYEYSMGLDYTHSLFQPLSVPADGELVFITPASTHFTKEIPLPNPLLTSSPPFSDPNPHGDASPNKVPFTFASLAHNDNLDTLPPANTSWAELSLLTNTFTRSVPGIVNRNTDKRAPSPPFSASPTVGPRSRRRSSLLKTDTSPVPEPASASEVTWNALWFYPHARALLRRYMRTPQGALSAHEAAVGGDYWYDLRGGRGGVWTSNGVWMGWGEEVCKGVEADVFGDDKGEWLKEGHKEVQEEAHKEAQEEAHKEEAQAPGDGADQGKEADAEANVAEDVNYAPLDDADKPAEKGDKDKAPENGDDTPKDAGKAPEKENKAPKKTDKTSEKEDKTSEKGEKAPEKAGKSPKTENPGREDAGKD